MSLFTPSITLDFTTLFVVAICITGLLGLLLLFAFAMSWLGIWMGLNVPSVEVAQQVIFTVLFPLTFVSSAFVPVETMPGWLQPIAEHNPFTIVTNATRALYNGRDPGSDLWLAWAWAIGIALVFGVLATRKFASTTGK